VDSNLNNRNIFSRTENSDIKKHLKKVEGPIFIGRTWTEYLKMFDLSAEDLIKGKILDCAAGASSFTAEMSKKGYDVTALDIMYDKEADVLCNKYNEHMEILVEGLGNYDHFVWKFFSDPEDLKDKRNSASKEFITDYRTNRYRYIPADLKNIPFPDNSFTMVLCSHLLFIYDHRLSYEFHLDTIKEMLRVTSSEVRIYPLVKNKGLKSDFVKRIIQDLTEADISIVKVDYEFRTGGNEMMLIRKL
jgi:hypothetical protein